MIESEGQSPTEQTEKKSLFPISEEAANNALRAISENPNQVIETEWQQMTKKDPTKDYLGVALHNLAKAEDDESAKDFKAGAAFAHRILREQADLAGKKVPAVSPAEYEKYVKDEDALWETFVKEKEKTGIDPNDQVFNRITSEDPEFGKSLLDNIPYPRRNTGPFRYGITETYLPLKRAEELTKREDKK